MKKFVIKPKIYFNEGSMEFLKEIDAHPPNPQQPSREDLMNIYHKAF
ncbi:hypothetical protein [Desulforamulus aquiferis]|uniref:Uncharacterized protein n=1 Tax=Desulforamulus aquiferis TaxID=1397668 RepID=A0AAW7ZDG8_9FIRM|nr:hypothetical protein [Desulforamulus aquiferis]MDO7787315.1 hypothetical protein [Desulforamulus aquiferis]